MTMTADMLIHESPSNCGRPSSPAPATAAPLLRPPRIDDPRRWPASVEAEAVGHGGGLDPGSDAELGEDVGDVDAGGLGADEQRLGDLAVAAPGRHQGQDLGLARGMEGCWRVGIGNQGSPDARRPRPVRRSADG